jgi:hypothetical protein
MNRLGYIALIALCATQLIAQDLTWWKKCTDASRFIPSSGGAIYPVFESATMTDSNAPAPVVVSSDMSFGNPPWMPFQRNSSYGNGWSPAHDHNWHWIQYDCGAGNSNVLGTIQFDVYSESYTIDRYYIQGSQDNVIFVTLTPTNTVTGYAGGSSAGYSVTLHPSIWSFYRTYRINVVNDSSAFIYVCNMELSSANFDGPIMTDTNTPSPYVATADSIYSDSSIYSLYLAFDRFPGVSSIWTTKPSTPFSHWIKLDMGSNVVVNGFCYVGGTVGNIFTNYVFSASLDDSQYTLIDSGSLSNVLFAQTRTNSNSSAYRYFQFSSSNGTAGVYVTAKELTFKHYK